MMTLKKTKSVCSVVINQEELERARQWFDAVQDLNAKFLRREDYALATRIYAILGIRIPDWVLRRGNALKKPGQAADVHSVIGNRINCEFCSALKNENEALRDAIEALHDAVKGNRFDDASVADMLNGAMRIPRAERA